MLMCTLLTHLVNLLIPLHRGQGALFPMGSARRQPPTTPSRRKGLDAQHRHAQATAKADTHIRGADDSPADSVAQLATNRQVIQQERISPAIHSLNHMGNIDGEPSAPIQGGQPTVEQRWQRTGHGIWVHNSSCTSSRSHSSRTPEDQPDAIVSNYIRTHGSKRGRVLPPLVSRGLCRLKNLSDASETIHGRQEPSAMDDLENRRSGSHIHDPGDHIRSHARPPDRDSV